MYDLSKKVCLIIPCYNEANRINFSEFNQCNSSYYFIFVNDGSKDNTLEILNSNIKDNMYVLSFEKNKGKAEAVRQGMIYAKKLPIFDEIEWVGYWDADLATPLGELDKFIRYSELFNVKVEAVWGSRIYKLGSTIKRSWKRHICGRIFATLIKMVLNVETYDSQCGAKIFRKELIEEICSTPFISRWIFDVEIWLRLKKCNIVEYPLEVWEDISGSKINVIKEAPRTLIEIWKIRKKYKQKAAVEIKEDGVQF